MEILGEEHSFLTKIKASNYIYKYKWTIQNFNMCKKDNGEFIISPTFQNIKNHCYMKLYPNGYDHHYWKYMSVTLHHEVTNEDSTYELLVDFSILNDKLEVAHTERGGYLDSPNIKCLQFIKHDILFDASKNLLVDNQLTIVCSMTKLNSTITNPIQCYRKNNKFNLSNDLNEILNSKLLTDMTLVVDGKEIHAHKLILMARSPVFAAMLQNDMKEKRSSKIEIEDVKTDVLTKMLEFMYTDKITNIEDYTKHLLYLANKYDIKGLKLLCEQTIVNDLTIQNFVDVFIFAETHGCDFIKQEVLKFIINNAGIIITTAQFQSWQKNLPSMVVDIVKANS